MSIVVDNVLYAILAAWTPPRASPSVTSQRRLAFPSPRFPRSSTAVTAWPRTPGPGPGGDRRSGVRGQPGRAEPAQPPHERHRHPGRRPRAVQCRTAQGRRGRDQGLRLRDGDLLRRRPRGQPRGLGAPLPLPAERDTDRRGRPGHADRGRRQLRRSHRRDRPAHRPVRAADDRLRQPARRPAGHDPPARTRPPPDRHDRRAARPAVRRSSASRGTARPSARPG